MHSIRRVEIKNFKCHEELQWVLSEGITTIVAPNGWGKSSFVQAIAWCLFGSPAAPATQEDLIRTGAEECFVSVSLEIVGMSEFSELYTFERSYSVRDGTMAHVYCCGDLKAEKSTGVDEFLKRAGIDLDGFHMIYAEQGELAFFVHATPAIRKQIISSLFQVDVLDDLIGAIRESHKEILREREGLPDLDEHKTLHKRVKSYHAEMYTYNNAVAEMENEYEELKGRLTSASDSIRLIPQVYARNKKIASLEVAVAKLYYENKSILNDLPGKDFQDDVEHKVEVSTFVHRKAKNEYDKVETEYVALVADYDRAEMSLKEIEGGFCPTCGAEGITLFEYKQGLEEQQKIVRSCIDSVNEESSRLRREFEETDIEHQKLMQDYASYQKWEEEGFDSRLVVIQEKITEYQESISQEKRELAKIGEIDVTEIESLQLQVESQVEHISDAKALARTAKYKRDQAQERIDGELQELATLELMTSKEANLGKLKKAMPLFRDVILAQSLEWVAVRASTLLSSAMVQPMEVKIDTDLNFWVNNRKLNHYSSGQIDLACVCIRVAIAEYLSKRIGFAGLLILDGVFDRIDEDNRDAIGRLLSEINLDQVIVLSHFKVPIIGGREIRFR